MTDDNQHAHEQERSFQQTAYPVTDSAEVNSVHVVESLLNPDLVKSHINERDKIPDTDGYVEPVDQERRSIGRMHVQVKTLSKADIQRKGYTASEGFLAFCKKSPDPCLIIGVDVERKHVYWCEVTRVMVKQMERGSSRTVRFDPANVISEGKQDYYQPWVDAIKARQEAFELYDEFGPELKKARLEREVLKNGFGGIPVEASVNVSKVQAFLDEYNQLMFGEFSVLAERFNPTARKFGFAYYGYHQTHVEFTLFEIDRQSTDTDIKKANDATFLALANEGLTLHLRSERNPIEDDPLKYAGELVEDKVERLLRYGALKVDQEILAREMIFAVIDKAHQKFGLGQRDKYTVDEVRFALREFAPRWVINFMNNCTAMNREALLRTIGSKGYFDLGFAGFGMDHGALERVYEMTRTDVDQGIPFKLDVPIGLGGYPLGHFAHLLEYLQRIGVKQVERFYPKYDHNRLPHTNWIYKWLSGEDLVCKAKLYYSSLPIVYNQLIKDNFPRLVNELEYTRLYDRQVVIVTTEDEYLMKDARPERTICNMKCLDGDHNIIVDVYAHTDSNVPDVDIWDPEKKIVLDGKRYRLVSGTEGSVDELFEPMPLYKGAIVRLTEEMRELFKRRRSG